MADAALHFGSAVGQKRQYIHHKLLVLRFRIPDFAAAAERFQQLIGGEVPASLEVIVDAVAEKPVHGRCGWAGISPGRRQIMPGEIRQEIFAQWAKCCQKIQYI